MKKLVCETCRVKYCEERVLLLGAIRNFIAAHVDADEKESAIGSFNVSIEGVCREFYISGLLDTLK